MQIYDDLVYIKNSSLALGYFDGVHLGHQVVLNNAVHIAKKTNNPSSVITFKEHPLNYLSDVHIPQILTIDERLEKLSLLDIDNVILLDFNKYSHIKAAEYLENVLIKYFSPIAITTGFNHSFGYNKEGNSKFLNLNKDKYGYKYFEVPPLVIDENIVSCSVIRNKIQLGDFQSAAKLLGYNFFIRGTVIKGDQIASKLGYPSANIHYDENKVTIPHGVYYVIASLNGKKYNGILNHGYAPTFDNEEKLKTEIHIIDFNQNIYGKNIQVEFIAKIRNQNKFSNTEKLKEQIKRDIAFAQIYQYFLQGRNDISLKRFNNGL